MESAGAFKRELKLDTSGCISKVTCCWDLPCCAWSPDLGRCKGGSEVEDSGLACTGSRTSAPGDWQMSWLGKICSSGCLPTLLSARLIGAQVSHVWATERLPFASKTKRAGISAWTCVWRGWCCVWRGSGSVSDPESDVEDCWRCLAAVWSQCVRGLWLRV
jgi:hypothetical protein